ncbi:MAG: STAS domain-containing protein [Candidatus Limnocylindria bacterium]
MRGRINRADGAALCELVRLLADRGTHRPIVCHVADVAEPDLDTVDALARLQLTAQRLGCKVWLHDASSELRELLALVGLRDVVPCSAELRVEAKGQVEEREEPCGVEEEADPADPTA